MAEPARQLNNLATAYSQLGKLAEAEECFKRALSIAEKNHVAGGNAYTQVLMNYAELLRMNGRKRESAHMKDLARDSAGESRRVNGIGMVVSASSLRDGR